MLGPAAALGSHDERKLRVLISAILLTPTVALGLGLGEIRLNSALNEPLSAEIDLVAATPEELAALEAQPGFEREFSRVTASTARPTSTRSNSASAAGRTVAASCSCARATRSANRSFRSCRRQLAARPLAARVHGAARSAGDAGARRQPGRGADCGADDGAAAAAAAAPAPAPAAPAPAPAGAAVASGGARGERGSTYQVARGDTLYGIAGTLAGGDRQAIQRTMIALFRANPEAFNGNINQLRAGAILRVPTSDEIAGICRRRGGERSQPAECGLARRRRRPEAGRLQLVTPPEGEAESAAAAGTERTASNRRSTRSRRTSPSRSACSNCATRNWPTCSASSPTSRAEEAAGRSAAPPAAGRRPQPPQPDRRDGRGTRRRRRRSRPTPPPAEASAEARAKPKPAAQGRHGPSFFDTLTDNWMMLLGAAALADPGPAGLQLLPPPPRRGRRRRAQGLRPAGDRRRCRRRRCACGRSRPATGRPRCGARRCSRTRTTTTMRTSSSRNGRSRARRPRRRARAPATRKRSAPRRRSTSTRRTRSPKPTSTWPTASTTRPSTSCAWRCRRSRSATTSS